jgi:hypothetical protein
VSGNEIASESEIANGNGSESEIETGIESGNNKNEKNENENDHNHNLNRSRWIESGGGDRVDQVGRSHSDSVDDSGDENMCAHINQRLVAERADGTKDMVPRGIGLSKTFSEEAER